MKKYKQDLPIEVEARLDTYIERIKSIKWFQPSPELDRSEIDNQVSIILKAFGVEAGIEYRKLQTFKDWDAARGAARGAAWDAAWDAARGAAWDAARDAARGAARGAAWDAAWDAARGAAWDAAWDAARGAARGACDLLSADLTDYNSKYPNGSFINLIPLWEAGLYPIGVIDGKFVVYVPPSKLEFPSDLT